MYLILTICILTIVVCYIVHYRRQLLKNSINTLKHVYQTKNLEYAHFSKINKYSRILFPELLFTNMQSFVLKKGESMFIPKGWWHWVETMCPTIAVNYWISEKISDTPYVKKCDTTNCDNNWFDLVKDIELKCWDENNKKIMCNTLDNLKNDGKHNNIYVITLDAFPAGRFNRKQLEPVLSKLVNKPHPKAEQPNFWISIGYHDTGLHFDDKDGFLTVLDGQKNIKLFPPQATKLLHPFPLKPEWTYFKTDKIVYANEFKTEKSKSLHVNQGSELYTYLNDKCKESSIFSIIDKLFATYGPNKIVWGLKKNLDGTERLEFYKYHFKNTEISHDILESEEEITKSLYKTNEICTYEFNSENRCNPKLIQKKDLMIHSFDVYFEYPCVDNKIHLYYKDSMYDNNDSDYLGHCVNIDVNNNIAYEGQMFGCHWSDSLNLQHGFNQIKYTPTTTVQTTIEKLIPMYPCRLFFLWNKKDYILIQFCTLQSTLTYIEFLKEYNYSPDIVNFINTNTSDYHAKNISHEIGFSIDKNTGEINRTAIYGII
jgi:hypothetical protein